MGKKIEGLAESILNATIRLGAKNGVANLSVREIAASCGVSETSVLKLYQSKHNLFKQAFFSIDKMINDIFADADIDEGDLPGSIEKCWTIYCKFLTDHKTETKYYAAYRSSAFYDVETAKEQIGLYPNFISLTDKYSRLIRSYELKSYATNVLWDYIISNTLKYAVQIVDGQIPSDEESLANIFKLIFSGVLAAQK